MAPLGSGRRRLTECRLHNERPVIPFYGQPLRMRRAESHRSAQPWDQPLRDREVQLRTDFETGGNWTYDLGAGNDQNRR